MSLTMIARARASALLFGGAALSCIRLPGRAQANSTIRLATVPTDGASAPYYAKDMGFFAKAGLDVDIEPMQSAPAIAAAVSSGAIDIGYSPVDVLASIHQKNIPLVIIAPASEYVSPAMTRSAALVLPANSPVHQAKDLTGRIVASNGLHSFGEEGARAWIDQNGGDSSTVKWVEMPLAAMPAALDAGRIDAAFVVEPFLAGARKSGRVLGYGYDSIAKHFVIGTWFTTPQWAKDHTDLVKRFAAVMHDTAVWANGNQAQSGEILAKYMKLDPAVVATMVRAHYAEQLTASVMQPLIDVSAKYNGFKTFPAQELIYTPSR
jgi:NitT/TauT family transport system substrate-binding protein